MTLSVCRMPLKFFGAGIVSLEIAPTPSCILYPGVDSPPQSLPLCHETDPLSGIAVEIVECGEADKVAVLVIIEPTDMWETARWRGAVIETPRRRTNGWVCSVHEIREYLCTCSCEDQTSYRVYFWMCCFNFPFGTRFVMKSWSECSTGQPKNKSSDSPLVT